MLKNCFLASISGGFLVYAGCAADPAAVLTDASPEVRTVDSSASECNYGDTEECSCGVQEGVRICVDGSFQACECGDLDDDRDDSQDLFADCAPGRYEGTFEGWAGFLVESTPVSALDLSGMPGLVINLERPVGGGEFLEVGDGFMKGNANGTFPFEASIKGRLDCGSLEFRGEVVGSVQLFVDGIDNPFTGTMTSKYDLAKKAFVDGKWMVKGSNADAGVDFGLVGSGSWSATHTETLDGGSP